MSSQLTRFWFEFEKTGPITEFGYGVTARDKEDAVGLLQETVFAGKQLPKVAKAVINVDVSTLDQKHVVPNMEAPVFRGVWFPKGHMKSTGDFHK